MKIITPKTYLFVSIGSSFLTILWFVLLISSNTILDVFGTLLDAFEPYSDEVLIFYYFFLILVVPLILILYGIFLMKKLPEQVFVVRAGFLINLLILILWFYLLWIFRMQYF